MKTNKNWEGFGSMFYLASFFGNAGIGILLWKWVFLKLLCTQKQIFRDEATALGTQAREHV